MQQMVNIVIRANTCPTRHARRCRVKIVNEKFSVCVSSFVYILAMKLEENEIEGIKINKYS